MNELTRTDIKNLAAWLREVFPKEYKVSSGDLIIDTTRNDTSEEFAVMLVDHDHKKIYLLPEMGIRKTLQDVDNLIKKGVKEFEPLKKLGMVIHSSEYSFRGKTQ